MCVLMSKRGIDQFPIALGAGPKTQQGPRALAVQQDLQTVIVCGAAGGWDDTGALVSSAPSPA